MSEKKDSIKKLPPKKNSYWIVLYILVLLIIVSILTGLVIDSVRKRQELSKLHQQLNVKLQKLQQQQQEQDDVQLSNMSRLQQQIQQLHSQANQVVETNQDWLLIKARFYLELAQINSFWSPNYETSIALLNQADSLLKQSNSAQLLAVRQAIAQEIVQLKAIPIIDSVGLLGSLDAIGTNVARLVISSPLLHSQPSPKANVTAQTWRDQFKQSMNSLGKLVIIRSDEETMNPMILPLFHSITKETIQLNLQQAQWAVLNRNQDVYHLALNQALRALQKISAQTSQAQALISQLKSLEEIQLTQPKPNSGAALSLLNQVIENKKMPSSKEGAL